MVLPSKRKDKRVSKREPIERFMDKVQIVAESGCWIWTGSVDKNGDGYANFSIKRKAIKAHRASWILHHGVIPEGMLVCHVCDVKCCVNPSHLFLGTPKDNTQDMIRKGREKHVRGEASPRAKFSESTVRQMRADYKSSGVSYADIGRKYGTSRGYAAQIINNEAWSHLK